MPKQLRLITYQGKTQSVSAWAKELDISISTIAYRLRRRFSTEQVLSKNPLPRRKTAHCVTYQGKTQSIYTWAAEIGMDYATLRSRILNYKWSLQKAFTTPTIPRLADWLRLDAESLPAGVQSGYEAFKNNHSVGMVYKIKANKWTHSEVIRPDAAQYSQSWSNRYEAVIDLIEKTGGNSGRS